MEVQDGFIVGIFNYCDRWCERCPFTSRCRVFTEIAEEEFERDHGPLTEPMLERETRQMAEHAERWKRDWGIDFAKIDGETEKAIKEEEAKDPEGENRRGLKLEYLELNERTHDFTADVHQWLRNREYEHHEAREALEVIGRFRFFVGGKVYRALMGLSDDQLAECDDKEGSAKAAIIALERMRDAWEKLVALAVVPQSEVMDFIENAKWMVASLDRTFPDARAFVRPGIDEPDEVRALEAREL